MATVILESLSERGVKLTPVVKPRDLEIGALYVLHEVPQHYMVCVDRRTTGGVFNPPPPAERDGEIVFRPPPTVRIECSEDGGAINAPSPNQVIQFLAERPAPATLVTLVSV